ncbi:MAG: GNAT family N-acetyltransferase [Pseudomonadota bacterium]
MQTSLPHDLLRRMQTLAQQIAATRLEFLTLTSAELAWSWAKDLDAMSPYWRVQTWEVAGELRAWAWATLPHRLPRGDGYVRVSDWADLRWQVHPDQPELFAHILDWYAGVAPEVSRTLTLQDGHKAERALIQQAGYDFDTQAGGPTGNWVQLNRRALADLAPPSLPEGFGFADARNMSAQQIVDLHRATWHPSSFTTAALARVQATWPYDPALHVFVISTTGLPVASALIWLDADIGLAEFEPVGTAPDHQRQGLATALLLHGMARARASGAHHMLVACMGAESKRAARQLYQNVGFRPISRDMPFLRTC